MTNHDAAISDLDIAVSEVSNEQKTKDRVPYNKLVWNTGGGGDLHFIVQKQGSNFIIERQEMNFQEDYAHYVLTPDLEETIYIEQEQSNIDTKKVYQELLDIYTNPERNTPKPPEPEEDSEHPVATGSWTSLEVCTYDEKNCYEIERGSYDLYWFVALLPMTQKTN
ncbi:hypothetical protein [Neisseria sp. Ec49-e6-T10]|uniref:hypothetical protein n=1 Tax=Neisseria sp. Ec49-e6-T10 TaxID=3140744 RepID=UPI003EBD5FF1